MKKYLFLIALSLVCFFGWTSFSYLQERNRQPQDLELSINPSKSNYVKGEIVNLTFSLKNKGAEDLTFTNNFNVDDGYLHLYISQDGKGFKEYFNPRWGRANTVRSQVSLKQVESIESSANILWNKKPETTVSEQIRESKILTDYAFFESGTYFVKSVYTAYFGAQQPRVKIESEPIQITVEEPTGEDLKVWNKIKTRGEFAYFIQEGRFPESKFNEKEQLKQEVEQIINQYPNSLVANQLKQSLEKFQANEEKLKDYMQKLQQSKEKNQ